MKSFYLLSMTIGGVYLATTVLWVVYNSYIPIMLKSFGISSFLVGLIMTIDNFLAITWGPLVGNLSDHTRTSVGKRLPYFIVSFPMIAILFALIPATLYKGLVAFSGLLLLINLFVATARTPIVALIPDLFASTLRSRVSGIVNFMGGIGAMIGYLVLPWLFSLNQEWPFLFTSVIVVVCGGWLVFYLRENQEIVPQANPLNIIQELKALFSHKELTREYLAIFTYFLGFNAIETFFTSYGVFRLGIGEAQASLLLGVLAVSFFLFSIPAGIIGSMRGKKQTMSAGLLGLSAAMGLMFLTDIFLVEYKLPMIALLLFVSGFCWALVNVNVFPYITDLSPPKQMGTAAGFYYFFSMMAAVVSPPLTGFIIDISSHNAIFLIASLFLSTGCLFHKKFSFKPRFI